jgi:hypothetical protein
MSPDAAEDYVCKCGLEFENLADLQAHWADPERQAGVPHYRAGRSSSDKEKWTEDGIRSFPPIRSAGEKHA